MNNFQIQTILNSIPKARRVFLGCRPADNIPSSNVYPYAVVINTDKTGYQGEHWVAIYVQSPKTIEYFDTFGDIPNQLIGKYLLRFEHIHRNQCIIQSLFSSVCGQFCIYFILRRCKGVKYDDILKRLTSLKNPDEYVRTYVQNLCS